MWHEICYIATKNPDFRDLHLADIYQFPSNMESKLSTNILHSHIHSPLTCLKDNNNVVSSFLDPNLWRVSSEAHAFPAYHAKKGGENG